MTEYGILLGEHACCLLIFDFLVKVIAQETNVYGNLHQSFEFHMRLVFLLVHVFSPLYLNCRHRARDVSRQKQTLRMDLERKASLLSMGSNVRSVA